MYIGPGQISPATVGWLGNGCPRGGVTRTGLARGLGGREGWLTHDGRPSTVTGMRVLPLPAEEPGLTLPEAAPRFASSSGRPAADDPGGAPPRLRVDDGEAPSGGVAAGSGRAAAVLDRERRARAAREAAYRPLPNAGVTMDDIPEPHLEATVERRRLEPVIPAVQDTATLNCGTLAATSGPESPRRPARTRRS